MTKASGAAPGSSLQKAASSGALHQAPLLAVLVVLWMLLWGELSILNLVIGIAFAFAVTRVYYLPPVELSGRFNVFWFSVFIGRFLGSVAVASFSVAFLAVDVRSKPTSAIVGVQLRTRSDLITTLVSIVISLIPGSLVVETDRSRSIVYLHVLNTRSMADVKAMRRQVLRIEASIVKALGSVDDIRRTR
ncbi:Na+/H+ antiporter subunit E [Salinibacterium sp. ZJ454]|uniref:Na+/H+ antiporter subunit E n=1 Tax=Salinibacterium sp. ZJ454 TaxID=2708339 RepID=UPI0014225F44|nr:Na+/H+ antiporter subunit E [Salinibacterium sp. ZJ454]